MIATFLMVCSAAADDETNRELARTYANFYIRQKDFKQAQTSLASHLEQDPADTEAWNLMGLASMEIQDFNQAKQAFYKASADLNAESRGIYLYHYADVLARSGDAEKAKDALVLAAQFENVKESAKIAMKELKANEKLPKLYLTQKSRWYRQVSISSGYDTNVMMAPNTTLANLSQSDIASPNVMAMAKWGFVKSRFTREFESSLLSAFSYQTNPAAYQFTSLYGAFNAEYRENGDEFAKIYWAAPGKADIALLNTSGLQVFNWNGTFNPKVGYRLNGTDRMELEVLGAYRYFMLASGYDAVNNRTGFAMGGTLTYRSYLGAWEYSVGAKFDRQFATGSNFNSMSYLIPIQFTSPILFWSSRLSFKADVGVNSYPYSSYSRQDTVVNPSAIIFRKFGKDWTMTGTLGTLWNMSNVTFADYKKYYVTLMAGYEF